MINVSTIKFRSKYHFKWKLIISDHLNCRIIPIWAVTLKHTNIFVCFLYSIIQQHLSRSTDNIGLLQVAPWLFVLRLSHPVRAISFCRSTDHQADQKVFNFVVFNPFILKLVWWSSLYISILETRIPKCNQMGIKKYARDWVSLSTSWSSVREVPLW